MNALLLRLAGPMQSWGTQSRFEHRDTGLEPSKSGVVGLVCAALGRPRAAAVDDLAALRLDVRVDREGTVRRDFHTVLGVAGGDGKVGRYPAVTERFYLADADFLVALSGPDLALLAAVEAALRRPVWPLFLGRKAFVPAVPVHLPGAGGLRPGLDGPAALRQEPWNPRRADRPNRRGGEPDPPLRLRFVLEQPAGSAGGERRLDQPGPGAAFADRVFLPRLVATEFRHVGGEAGDVPLGEPDARA